MNDQNLALFTGRLTRDPEQKVLGNGSKVTRFALAVNKSWKGKDGEYKEKVVFVELNAWNGLGDFVVNYCSKGDPVRVQSELETNTNEEGRVFTSFKVDKVEKLSWNKEDKEVTTMGANSVSSREDSESVKTPTKRGRKPKNTVEDDDSIPF